MPMIFQRNAQAAHLGNGDVRRRQVHEHGRAAQRRKRRRRHRHLRTTGNSARARARRMMSYRSRPDMRARGGRHGARRENARIHPEILADFRVHAELGVQVRAINDIRACAHGRHASIEAMGGRRNRQRRSRRTKRNVLLPQEIDRVVQRLQQGEERTLSGTNRAVNSNSAAPRWPSKTAASRKTRGNWAGKSGWSNTSASATHGGGYWTSAYPRRTLGARPRMRPPDMVTAQLNRRPCRRMGAPTMSSAPDPSSVASRRYLSASTTLRSKACAAGHPRTVISRRSGTQASRRTSC